MSLSKHQFSCETLSYMHTCPHQAPRIPIMDRFLLPLYLSVYAKLQPGNTANAKQQEESENLQARRNWQMERGLGERIEGMGF